MRNLLPALIPLLLWGISCAPRAAKTESMVGAITVEQIEELRSREALLPLAPDSILARYRRYDRDEFYRDHADAIEALSVLIDSLNTPLAKSNRIDTLSIDHTFENIGVAGRTGKTLTLSSSYFFLYEDYTVLRSVTMHEFGHIHYELLSAAERAEMERIWQVLRGAALLYLFQDGEYTENARWGGHPEESAEELFASAFNVVLNRWDELAVRLQFVEPRHLPTVEALMRLVRSRPGGLSGKTR